MRLEKKIFLFLCVCLLFSLIYYIYIEIYSNYNIIPKILPYNFNKIQNINEPFYNK